jgi:hypothetical protein
MAEIQAQISLAKALKLKNRLAGRLSQVVGDIQAYNSVLEEQVGKVDVKALLENRNAISLALVELKIGLYKANVGIQRELYTLAEKKGEIDFYRMLNTRDGSERHGYQNTNVTYKATVLKAEVDAKIKALETEVDSLQDQIDSYNHSTKFAIAQAILDLAS